MAVARLRVLISGAGIAGATLACLLTRAGHETVVVERDRGLRSSGNPVDVRGAAFDVVDRLGLVPSLRAHATTVREVRFVDARGRARARLPSPSGGPRSFELPRADLSAELVRAATGADIRFDESIVHLRPETGGVHAVLEHGDAGRFDVVVGADGIRSEVRRLAFGGAAAPEHLGMMIATAGVVLPGADPDAVLMHNVPGSAVGLHGAGVILLLRAPDRPDPGDRAAGRRRLTAAFGAGGWRSRELLDAYLTADDVYFDALSRVRSPSWVRGRVALLGDAASCVSLFGNGSSSAIEGAAVLAEALTASPEDVAGALTRYERRHRPVVARRERGFRVAEHLLVPFTTGGIAARDAALRVALGRPPGG